MKRLTQEQWREYNNATNCSICIKPFKSADKKFRNHDDLTDEYRGPAHNACSLNYCINPKKLKIPCIIYNLKGILFLCYHNCQFLKLILIAIFIILTLIAIFYLHNLQLSYKLRQCRHFSRYFLYSCYICCYIVFSIRRSPYTVSC